ncbi:MAG TPA: glycoside hydrolase family 57 protein [Paludibacteraceae bacterium]|nr:glycoside hydrolase family 57 protein [Paludibacteraceae bacterium]
MKNICFYFEIHQPLRLKRYRFFEIGQDHYYYDDFQAEERIRAMAEQSYLPANRTIAEMIRSSNGKFKCAFSISGVALEQLEQYAPEVIDSFKELAQTGSIEFLAEPYAHSLASLYDTDEFVRQINLHAEKLESLFGKKPTAVRNSELIYSNEIGEIVSKLGYKTILIEQVKDVLGWKSPNYIYCHPSISKLKLLVRNNKLSDDISFRFSNRNWSEFPLTSEKFIGKIAETPETESIFNVWMGYEALGFYQHPESGIFEFLKAMPYHAIEQGIGFVLPSDAPKKSDTVDSLSYTHPTSWAESKDISVWNGNDLQQEALSKLYAVSERVHLCNDKPLQHDWMLLQTTDNFRYMSHYDSFGTNYVSPYEAFTNYMNVLADFLDRVDAQYPTNIENEELNELLKTINNQEKEIERLESEIKKLKARKEKK